ncbi:MAG: hypothetical protein ACRER2_01115 [Methylococcales bacterium]
MARQSVEHRNYSAFGWALWQNLLMLATIDALDWLPYFAIVACDAPEAVVVYEWRAILESSEPAHYTTVERNCEAIRAWIKQSGLAQKYLLGTDRKWYQFTSDRIGH